MKYVTLEHRQSLPYGVIGCTYINFDTNDTTFENEAHELRRQRNSKQEEAKNQIIDESGHVFGTILQIKNELNNLRHDTPILKRFSKVYRNETVYKNRFKTVKFEITNYLKKPNDLRIEPSIHSMNITN